VGSTPNEWNLESSAALSTVRHKFPTENSVVAEGLRLACFFFHLSFPALLAESSCSDASLKVWTSFLDELNLYDQLVPAIIDCSRFNQRLFQPQSLRDNSNPTLNGSSS
jgi:hypothetical protein